MQKQGRHGHSVDCVETRGWKEELCILYNIYQINILRMSRIFAPRSNVMSSWRQYGCSRQRSRRFADSAPP